MFRRCAILAYSVFALAGCGHNAASDEGWLESYNRGMFAFNTQFNTYVTKPVARGYRAVTTKDIRNRVDSVINNFNEPVSAGNHVLQGNFSDSVVSVGRFLINSTLGLGGMFDVASGWGLQRNKTTFDATLASWCIYDGSYIVVPFLGPSTPRALVGSTVDAFANPVYLASANDKNYSDKITWSYAGIVAVAAAERSLDLLEDLEKNSVDFYSAMKSTYMQNRNKMKSCVPVNDDTPKTYDFDFEIDEEE